MSNEFSSLSFFAMLDAMRSLISINGFGVADLEENKNYAGGFIIASEGVFVVGMVFYFVLKIHFDRSDSKTTTPGLASPVESAGAAASAAGSSAPPSTTSAGSSTTFGGSSPTMAKKGCGRLKDSSDVVLIFIMIISAGTLSTALCGVIKSDPDLLTLSAFDHSTQCRTQ